MKKNKINQVVNSFKSTIYPSPSNCNLHSKNRCLNKGDDLGLWQLFLAPKFLLYVSVLLAIFKIEISVGQTNNWCPLQLTGPNSTCRGAVGVFTIDNYDPSKANCYTWQLTGVNGVANINPVTVVGGSTFTFTYQNIHISTYKVQVTFFDPVRNVSCIDSIIVYPCCDTVIPVFVNPKETDLPGYSNQTVSGQTFMIAGELEVTSTLNLVNSNVLMTPGSRIRVPSGKAILIESSVVSSCNEMWEGIVLEDQSSIKVINSTIADAAYALNVVRNVEGYVTGNTLFDRNMVSFYAGPSNTHSMNFSDFSNFTITGANPLKTYYFGMQPRIRTGFVCINFSNLRVGNFGVQASGPINIIDIPRGFDLRRSNFSVELVGFTRVQNAIDAIFQHPTSTGGFICNVSNNSFFNCPIGVWLREYTGSATSPVEIRNNLFNVRAGGHFVNGRAIRVTNGSPIPSYLRIHSDTIKFYNSPIVVSNVTGLSKLDVSLMHNSIEMNQGAAQFNNLRNGIRVSSCAKVAIIDNRVERSNLLSFAQTPNFNGLSIEFSPDGIVSDNTFVRCGTAVFYRGSILGTQNSCNNLLHFDRGFHLEAATISDQGSPIAPQDNKWNNSRGRPFKISGTGQAQTTLPLWYYRAGNSFDVMPSDQTYVSPFPLTNQPSAPTCGEVIDDPGDIDNPEFVDDSLNIEIIEDSIEFLMATENNRQMVRHQLYRMLQSDTTILAEHADLDYFYANYSNVNIQLFDSYYAALGINDLSTARQVLNTIQATGEYQNDLYTVSDLYLKTRENPDYVFTENEVIALENIAYKSVFRCGDAVISARLLLGIEIEDALPVSQRMGKVVSSSDSGIFMTRSFNVYYFYGYDGLPAERIEVYNLSGQLLNTKLGGEINADLLPVGSLVKVISGQNVKVYRGL